MHAMRRPTRPGFSYLDILLASLFLGIGILPLLELVRALTLQTGATRTRVLARALAGAVVERYRVEPLGELATRLGSAQAGAQAIEGDKLLALPQGQVTELVRASKMRRSVELRPVAGTARKGVLVATVEWEEDRRARRYEMRALVVDDVFPTGAPEATEVVP